jgi:hypothetical protein
MPWVNASANRLSSIVGVNAAEVPAIAGFYQYPVGVQAGSLSGTVTVSGVLNQRRIWVHHRESGRLVAEAFSHPTTGAFIVPNLDPRLKFYAVCFDDVAESLIGTYDCDAHDGLIPE